MPIYDIFDTKESHQNRDLPFPNMAHSIPRRIRGTERFYSSAERQDLFDGCGEAFFPPSFQRRFALDSLHGFRFLSLGFDGFGKRPQSALSHSKNRKGLDFIEALSGLRTFAIHHYVQPRIRHHDRVHLFFNV